MTTPTLEELEKKIVTEFAEICQDKLRMNNDTLTALDDKLIDKS